MSREDERVAAQLLAAVPSLAGAMDSHRRDFGRLSLDRFLGEAIQVVIHEVRQGSNEALDQLAGFVGEMLSGSSDDLREIALRSFVDQVGGWAPSPELDAAMQRWPETVRVAVVRSHRQRVQVADGVWADLSFPGSERVAFEWTVAGPVVAVLLHAGVLYTAGQEVKAVDVASGQLLWRFDGHDDEPLESSGGLEILVVDGDVLEVVAPCEFRLRLDRSSGAELHWSTDEGGGRDAPDSALDDPGPGDVTVQWSSNKRVEVADASGETVAAIVSDRPSVDPARPCTVGDLLILPVSSGDVLALRVRP